MSIKNPTNKIDNLRARVLKEASGREYIKALFEQVSLILDEEEKGINEKIEPGLVKDNRALRLANLRTILREDEAWEEVKAFEKMLGGSFDIFNPQSFESIFDKSAGKFVNWNYENILDVWMKTSGRMADLDQMSGLYNRNAFYQDLMSKLHRGNKKFFLIYLDVDFFKPYNEIAHLFGDLGIKKVAEALIRSLIDNCKGQGKVYRYGGEELFVVVNCDQGRINSVDKARLLANNLKDEVRAHLIDWFTVYEGKYFEGRPVIKNFLRKKILEQKKQDVDNQFEKSGKLEKARDFIIQNGLDYFIPNVRMLSATKLITKIEDLLAGDSDLTDEQGAVLGKVVKEEEFLAVEAGTSSLGILAVDLSLVRGDHLMSDVDKNLVMSWVNSGDKRGYISPKTFREIFSEDFFDKGMTYKDFYQQLDVKRERIGNGQDHKAVTGGDELVRGLDNLRRLVDYNRVGRLATLASRIVEEGKKKDRNTVNLADLILPEGDLSEDGFVGLDKIDSREKRHRLVLVNQDYIEAKRVIRQKLAQQRRDLEVEKMQTVIKGGLPVYCQELFDQLDSYQTKKYLYNLIDIPETRVFIKLLAKGNYSLQDLNQKIKDFFVAQQSRYREAMTYAYNEQYMVDILNQEMLTFVKAGKNWSICSFDFDNLKAVNGGEGCSHDLGDIVLMESVYLIVQKFGDSKWLAWVLGLSEGEYLKLTGGKRPSLVRTGGEEFVAAFPGLSSQQVKRIQDKLNQEVVWPNNIKIVSSKFGGVVPRWGISNYIKEHYPLRSNNEYENKIGSLTSGIIDVQEWVDVKGLESRDYDKLDIREMRLISDYIGELGKKLIKTAILMVDTDDSFLSYRFDNVETYRGETINLDVLQDIAFKLEYLHYFKDMRDFFLDEGLRRDMLIRGEDKWSIKADRAFSSTIDQKRWASYRDYQFECLRRLSEKGFEIRNWEDTRALM